ncbi:MULTISPECIES: nitrate- and nitrite sensing domain-containing protein [unclassified Streptomyces]|uniref:sensor histidine kinase n=1 Tax=unclassified Streptomyces TaxID=2593676 RepID=UPI002E8142F1|nr:nitrate- and nitrite sensing domain-containing protein [Streptomyces sp. NBC_00589]WTI36288.1 nitrate- and nitrite sensing domain-containing protein [Streptomyces sp. NBC_00775]WUB30037.1 nitrate- and nitrite sensing domain-containing protein [Streptomyces sp. NBC_00589]
MRAPVQKTRPRRTGKQTASSSTEGGSTGDSAGRGRPAHVRNRLIVAVAVVAAAIAGAGAPTVLAASGQLNDSQNLVTLAQRTQQALVLAHSLADERDEVTSYIAAGRPKAKAPSEQRGARVDREVEELRADEDAPATLLKDLDSIASLRRAALTGKSTALEAHQAYSAAITELHALAEDLADQLPPRAGSGAHALAELDSAVQQSAAARGLLLAALNIPRTTQTVIDPLTGLASTTSTSTAAGTKQRDALSAAAQQARLRSDAALADFHETAPKTATSSYDSTVTGPDVTTAEKYLAGLTDQPKLSGAELDTSTKKLDAALSARIELMRGAEASLNDHRTKALAQLRDDDVTALEIRIALIGTLLLVAVGVSMAMARSLTRPLAVLRIGSARLAADPGTQEPVKFTGRNDEFAQVVRSVNALHTHAATLHERITTLEGDRKHLIGQRQLMADERDKLRTELADATAHLEQMRGSIHGTFVNLALRTLGLVERQLGVIEGLEEREQDPDRLATLFKLDHFATVMRRHSENLLVLAGAEHVQHHAGPVPLVDVVRAAVSEIERYERVRIAALPPHAHLAGFAADDISHLVAELLENASSFSPPDLPVEVSGWLLESGEVMLSVQDGGIGMTDERMSQLNSRLADFDPEDAYDLESGEGLGLGLYVVARLAHRHGVRVQLREQKQGGVTAVVVLPKTMLAAAPAVTLPTATRLAGGVPTVTLPGASAEANSNVLYGRSALAASASDPAGDEDPLIAAAEEAVRDAAAEPEPERETTAEPEPASAPEAAVPAPTVPAPREPEPMPTPERTPETTMELLLPDLSAEEAPRAFPEPPAEEAAAPEFTEMEPPAEEAARAFAEPAPQPTRAAPETAEATPAPTPEADLPAQTTTDPYAIGPDTHARVPDQRPRLTDKGLPKRTPKISTPAPAPRPRTGGVDADALRRRLGGFHRGAMEGRRDVEAEIAEQTAELDAPHQLNAQDVEASGGTVEEASS